MRKNSDLVSLGKQILSLREAKGFSQENFANSIDMNRGYYGTIERGAANPTALNLIRIAKGLKVSVGEIFPSRK
jgi:transcriptional regulator with XRE-family HTH domain